MRLDTGVSRPLFTWHVWDTDCVLLFPLFAIPLGLLMRTGLYASRGLPLGLGRGRAMRLALVGLAGTLGFGVLMAIAAAYATFDPGWGRGSGTDLNIEAGWPVSLASYLLASLASLLLPSRTTT